MTDLDREAIAEPVIQRFETCYDTLWKILKRYLVEELGLPEVPNSPKPVFRLAAENSLLSGATETWLVFADVRTAMSHDYSGVKAAECLYIMDDFIGHAVALFQQLSGNSWR